MKAVKSKRHLTPVEKYLAELLRTARTSFEPNFKMPVYRMYMGNKETYRAFAL